MNFSVMFIFFLSYTNKTICPNYETDDINTKIFNKS